MKAKLTIVMVVLFIQFLGFGIIIPVLPEMVQDAGAAPFHLGMMLAVYSAASFFMSPLWGALSDRWGRRPIIMIGILGFSVSFFVFGISSGHLWLMYLSRVLGGLFSGAATSCAVAYVADVTDEDNRTKGMGLVGMSIGLGFIFGPAAGGLFSVFGNEVPFFVSSALSFVTFWFAWLFLAESLPEEKRFASAGQKRPSRWTAFSGAVKYMYMLAFFVTFTLAGLESTLQYFEIEKFGATPRDIGVMFAVSGIVGAAIQGGVVRRLIKKGSEMKVIFLGLLLSACGFFLLLFSSNLFNASLYLSVFAAGNALVRPCVTSLITQKTKVGQGVASGLSSSMDSLGRITGPLLATAVFHFHVELPFILGGVLCVAALVLLYRFSVLDRRTGTPTAA